LDINVNGYGDEVTRFSRTVARFRLEVSDLPDYAIPFLSKCGDLDTVIFEDTVEGYAVIMKNVFFEFRAQGVGLNIGVFKFDAEVEAFSGCQPNYELAV